MRILLSIAAIALGAAGCSGSSQSCPTTSLPAGNFTLMLALQHTPDECILLRQADGGPGPADGSIVPSPQSVSSTLCAGTAEDGGATLYLVDANSSLVRQSPLDSDGGFTFVSPTVKSADTLCNCTADLDESISGNLLGAGDGGFTVIPDAGLVPQPTQIAGSVLQTLKSDAGNCLCNIPCAEHYTMSGTPNR